MARAKKIARLLAIVVVGSFFFSPMAWAQENALEPNAVFLIEPDGEDDEIGAAHDYATDVWADPWDMEQQTDLYRTKGFTNERFENGLFVGSTSSNDAYFWLLHQGYYDANNVGKTGLAQPIDASVYRRLTFKMYRSLDNSSVPLRVYWYKAGDEVTGQPCGVTQGLTPAAGWRVYQVDLSNPANWGTTRTCDWTGEITGLRIDPTSTSNTSIKDVLVKVDWVRLTDPTTETPYTIRWSGGDTTIALDVDEDRDPNNGVLMNIVSNLDASAQAYTWQGSGLPPGDYYIQARSSVEYGDGAANATSETPAPGSDLSVQSATSPGPLTINHAPVCKITAPSMTSGQDYATAALGNAWDMSHLADISQMVGIADYFFLNSILSATTKEGSSDPQVWLETGCGSSACLDADTYHYLTWRYRQVGVQNVGGGWVMRYLWTPTSFPNPTFTLEDVITLDGWPSFTVADSWHTYSLDLKKVKCEEQNVIPCWQGLQRYFRFDPTEVPTSQQFQLDYVLLTADDTAGSHYDIQWDCEDPDGDELTVSLYFDNNRVGLDGSHIATILASAMDAARWQPDASPQDEPAEAMGSRLIYLPLIRGGSGIVPCTGQCYTWVTLDVPEGTYYIYATVNDGHNTSHLYSQTPIIVDH